MKEYFYEAGSDLHEYTPLDYQAEPANFLPHVKNGKVRSWALKVHSLWLQLARKVAPNVEEEPDQHTLLPLPHPVVVPGSRFREAYYWDSYWIIRGLLVSKMFDTAKGVVENLIHLARVYGFVPNGGRAYYENRSQPPLLSAMVREVYAATNDVHLLEDALPVLIQEHKYWTSGPKQVIISDKKGLKHSLSRYNANWKAPRPESFTIDKQVAQGVLRSKQQFLYHDIASAAESGWDFSSRWMRDQMNLTTLFTSSIVPADLNAYLYQMETNIALMAGILGNKTVAAKFAEAAKARSLAMHSILWNDDMGQWFDYKLDPHECNVQSHQRVYSWHKSNQSKIIAASNFIPLWCGVLDTGDSRISKLITALKESGLLHSAGIATSLKETGQQWDFPNAWPPLQHMIIEGLAFSGSERGKKLARNIAHKWIETNYAVFEKTSHMQEKYSATVCGDVGGGGEYLLQTGFGWSNGVVLSLLNQFGWPSDIPPSCGNNRTC